MGSSAIGSSTVGSSAMGSNTKGSSTMGSSTMGSSAMGSSAMGSKVSTVSMIGTVCIFLWHYCVPLYCAGVQEVTDSEIFLSDGSTLRYGMALWAAGIGTLDFVKAAARDIGSPQALHAEQARGRLAVDEWTRVIGAPGVFAIGDCAHVVGSPYPATAQVASQAGTYLGRLVADGYEFDVDGPPALRPGAPGGKTLRTLRTAFNRLSCGVLVECHVVP